MQARGTADRIHPRGQTAQIDDRRSAGMSAHNRNAARIRHYNRHSRHDADGAARKNISRCQAPGRYRRFRISHSRPGLDIQSGESSGSRGVIEVCADIAVKNIGEIIARVAIGTASAERGSRLDMV